MYTCILYHGISVELNSNTHTATYVTRPFVPRLNKSDQKAAIHVEEQVTLKPYSGWTILGLSGHICWLVWPIKLPEVLMKYLLLKEILLHEIHIETSTKCIHHFFLPDWINDEVLLYLNLNFIFSFCRFRSWCPALSTWCIPKPRPSSHTHLTLSPPRRRSRWWSTPRLWWLPNVTSADLIDIHRPHPSSWGAHSEVTFVHLKYDNRHV